MPTKPNFFIIGAPKSGTTSLAHYLAGHPRVFMSDPKEPQHYNTDIDHVTDYADKADYLRLFDGVGPEHEAVGEASVWYLYSREAVPNILAEIPDARFIVLLRNPVEMAESLHDQMIYSGKETEHDFRRAWHLQARRREGHAIPRSCDDGQLLLYRDACAIGTQLQRVVDRVPPERLHIAFFDDLKTDSRTVYLETLRFLGLPDDGRTDFPVQNAAKTTRSPAVTRLLGRARTLKRALGLKRTRTGLLRPLAQWNIKERQREPLPRSLRREVLDVFLDEIEQVEALTRRDLSGWRAIQ